MIEVRNLTKRYSTFTAVDDISFTVEKGQILGFLGPNGAGKTTTMRVITGFMPPTKGTVVVAGFDVVEKPLEVKRRIGYLPESPPLYLEMTVNEYLAFAARLKQIPSAQVTEKIAGASQKAAISDVGDKVIKTLSKGYRQRVGLAQALPGSRTYAAVILSTIRFLKHMQQFFRIEHCAFAIIRKRI